MMYAGLFDWWISTITFNIAFVVVVSVYLYRRRKTGPRAELSLGSRIARVAKDFVFVWVMLGLLVFYIFTVGEGSALLFAAGNIVVEALLLLYAYLAGKGT